MSHSTHVGFNCPIGCPASANTVVLKFSPPSRPELPGPPIPSDFVGVGHIVPAFMHWSRDDCTCFPVLLSYIFSPGLGGWPSLFTQNSALIPLLFWL